MLSHFRLVACRGANGLVALRLLGIASSIPLKPLKKLFPYTWIGFALSWISGLALGVAAATTRLTNPILLVKVVLVMIAAYIMRIIEKRVFDNPDFKESQPGNAKILAGALVVLWVTITTMGRLIAYSASILGGG